MSQTKKLWHQLAHSASTDCFYGTDYYQIGTLVYKIVYLTEALHNLFGRSIAHIQIPVFDGIPHATFYILDNDLLKNPIKAPEGLLTQSFQESGICHGLEKDGFSMFFQPWFARFSVFNQNTNEGFYWVRSASEVPWWEPSFSFRELFHMSAANSSYQLVHAAAITDNLGNCWVIPAKSGSGKSSTCLTIAQAGYAILGDDFLVVDTATTTAYALYSFAKIDWNTLENRFPELKAQVLPVYHASQEKAYIDIDHTFKNQLKKSALISGILLPSLSKSNTAQFLKSTAKDAFDYLTHSTAHHLPHQRKQTVEKLARLAKKTNTYIWELPELKTSILTSYESFIS